MKLFRELNLFTKIAFVFGALLYAYGYICQRIPINFFWESKSIGKGLIFIGIIGVLAYIITKQKAKGKKTTWYKIAIGIILLIPVSQILLIIIIPNTDAYQLAKNYISHNEAIKLEVGEIAGFGLLPAGGVTVRSDGRGKKGNASIHFIVKGAKSYKIVSVSVVKDYEKDWEVRGME